MRDLETVHVCYSQPEADVLRSCLEAAGIPTLLLGREVASTNPHMMVAFGGIEVRVPSEHARDARNIIASAAPDDETSATPESDAFRERPISGVFWLVINFFFGYVPGWIRRRK